MIINKIDAPIYQILIVFSLLIGILFIVLSLKNENLLNKKIVLFFILFLVCPIICGKLFTFTLSGFKTNFFKSPLASYGGLIGVIMAAYIYEKIFPTNGKVIKYSIISLPLIYSFSKIACLVTGCCHGIPIMDYLI